MNHAFPRNIPAIGTLAVLAIFAAPSLATAQVMLKGAGATFPYPVYSRWFSEYQKHDVSVSFEYGYIGSGGGQKEILARNVDFGASDAPLSDEQLAKADGKILHIPTVAGAVVVACNVPGGDAIVLNGEAVAALFLGNITRWNDPRIAQLNPKLNLPDLPATVVHRSDDSGTTAIFTEYLAKVSPEWKDKLGHGKSVAWPTGQKGKGNKGVAEVVKATPGAVGYVELAAALQEKLPHAALINSEGSAVRASVETILAALTTARVAEDFRFSVTNAPGESAYPIVGATWLLVYRDGKDLARNRKLVQFIRWALTRGDDLAINMHYAPLPTPLEQQVLTALKKVKVP